MNNETIKVGEVTYNIANGSCSLHLLDGVRVAAWGSGVHWGSEIEK